MEHAARPSDCEAAAGTHSSAPDHTGSVAERFVSVSPQRSSALSDISRELAIQEEGREIEAAMERYAQSNCLLDRADADRHRLRMEELIRGRSAQVVARMEQERGLR